MPTSEALHRKHIVRFFDSFFKLISKYVAFNYWLFLTIILLAGLSFWFAYELRFEFKVPEFFTDQRLFLLPYVAMLKAVIFFLLGGHATNWRYVGLSDIPLLVMHSFLCSLGLFSVSLFAESLWIPRGVIIMDFFMTLIFIGGARISFRIVREKSRLLVKRGDLPQKRDTILIGAGDAGEMILREIIRNPESGFNIRAIFDDDAGKVNLKIHGIRVLGPINSVIDYSEHFPIDMAIVAIPSANNEQMQRIYKTLNRSSISVKTLPGLNELIDGSTLTQLRDVNISDLLGREEIKIDTLQVHELLNNRVVLVTGAGGSIGSELSRQILKRRPKTLILIDRAENSLFHIHRKLEESNDGVEIVPCLADVTSGPRMDRIFGLYKPELVFHAAAHKHVPMQELNAIECFHNNVGGMRVLSETALRHNARKFLLVSSDKAVNPTSIMGATKRTCELYGQAFGKQHGTSFLAVRFGNVLASEGSVVPIFMDQIARGGPITVTHPDMRRYFMTIPEAVTLMLQATAIGQTGQILILEMGELIKITDLVSHLVNLMGKAEGSIPIKYIGLRPGEKLFEEISLDDEIYEPTQHSKIKVFNNKNECELNIVNRVNNALDGLYGVHDDEEIRIILREIVPEYKEM